MKPIMLFICTAGLLMIGALAGQAQNQVSYGVKGGLNISNIHGDDWGESDNKFGAIGGVFVDAPVSDVFSVQPELLFTMKGSKASYEPYYLATERDSLVYLEIPVQVKATVPVKGNFDFSVFSGPSFGFLLFTRYELTGIDASLLASDLGVPTHGSFEDIGLDTHFYEFGVIFGAGLEYQLKVGKLLFDIRYNLGITRIFDTTPALDAKNGVFSIMTGYKY